MAYFLGKKFLKSIKLEIEEYFCSNIKLNKYFDDNLETKNNIETDKPRGYCK